MNSLAVRKDATQLRIKNVQSPVNARPKVTIYVDDNLGAWRPTLIPLSDETVNNLRLQHRQGLIELEEIPLSQEDDLQDLEMAWIQAHRQELVDLYAGEWVAVGADGLIAHAPNLAVLTRLASEAGVADPFITAVPREPIKSLKV